MTTQDETTAALNNCFSDYEGLLSELSAEKWNVQSLCPDWNIRGVAVHLSGIENLLVEWMPSKPDEWPPFPRMAEFEEISSEWDPSQLIENTSNILNHRRAELVELDNSGWEAPCMTPVGPGTYGRFMNIRIFDFWVHHRDMTIPLGIETIDSGPHAEIAFDEVHASLGFIVGKKIGLPDGMSIAFRLTGAMERDMFVEIDGRAQVVEDLHDPSVEITVDSTSFMMLTCGRIPPQAEIDAGQISWSGNDEWGEKSARNLRFTM
jgi:uncharacterized protein (TIGR03083 family)